MNFTEIVFVPFLLIVVGLQRVLPTHRARIVMLLAASYVFYAWWDASLLFLIVLSSGVDFVVGRLIHESRSPARRKAFLILSLATNLGLLAYFKYANFAVETLNDTFTLLGADIVFANPEVPLPVGISFYTFQTLSYSLDIYRRELEPERDVFRFFLFVAAFPQLVAGPIVRAKQFLPQLRDEFRLRADPSGLFYIVYGLSKKLLVADPLGIFLVDPTYASIAEQPWSRLLVASYGYAFQIFLDFSAYSDIAIGIGRLLGLELPLNFRAPYLATSIGEFWKRWHITLTTWFRDYVYIPLGGNRTGHLRNVFIVFLVSGLWHGAALTFIVWGALHGLTFLVERRLRLTPPRAPIAVALRWFVTFHVVTLAWIPFRAQSLRDAVRFLERLLSGAEGLAWSLSPAVFAAFVAAIVLHVTIEPRVDRAAAMFSRLPTPLQAASVMLLGTVCYALQDSALRHRAFIYFQF